jgi:6-phosphogluconolactonase
MFTRRRFLALFPVFAATTYSFASLPFKKKKIVPPPPVFVYFGTDTNKGVSKGIYQSRFNSTTGQLSVPVLLAPTARPSFLALSPARNGQKRFLYAVNAVNDPAATVTTFSQDPATGAINQLGEVTSGGAGPAYVSVDATGHAAFVANYFGSTVASYSIQPDGTLSQPVTIIDFKDKQKFGSRGPNTVRQDIPHPHCATVSPDNRFLLVCDLGSDAISVFVIDSATGHLTTSDPHLFDVRHGSGPRHVVFHPNGRWIYGINELDSTIDHFLWTTTSSIEKPQGLLVNTNFHIKTIAEDFPVEKNTAAEVVVSPDGQFLYASNRGEDTLVVFSIRPKKGDLEFVQRIPCGGKGPRQFTLDPTAQWLVCGNQDSASVTVFRRDAATGKLTGPIQTAPIDSPLFTLFA